MPPNDEKPLDWLREDLKEVKRDLSEARDERKALAERIGELDERIADLQQAGLDESRATLDGRAQCQRVVTDRLDRLERRDLGALVWEQRRTILGLLTGLLGVVGVAAAAIAPQVLPILDRLRAVMP